MQRPYVVGDPNSGHRTLQRDFNVDALVRPANFTNGGAGTNILRQRAFSNWDFSSLKTFRIVERIRFPRFGAPGNVVGTAALGVITSANTPRNLQFGLKLIW